MLYLFFEMYKIRTRLHRINFLTQTFRLLSAILDGDIFEFSRIVRQMFLSLPLSQLKKVVVVHADLLRAGDLLEVSTKRQDADTTETHLNYYAEINSDTSKA